MLLVQENTVQSEAIPVAAFKKPLRLCTGFSDEAVQDEILESFLRAAIAAVEARTGKVLLKESFNWSLTRWKDGVTESFPLAPVSQVLEVAAVARNDARTVIGSQEYFLQEDGFRPLLVGGRGVLPRIPNGGWVEVRFRAGYAEEWGDLPADLGHAVFLLAAHYYENRNVTGLGEGCIPFGVSALLQRYREVRLFKGATE